MYFIVHKTTSELERVILTTLYLAGVKNIDNSYVIHVAGMPCSLE
jgi:hypothetical protein